MEMQGYSNKYQSMCSWITTYNMLSIYEGWQPTTNTYAIYYV